MGDHNRGVVGALDDVAGDFDIAATFDLDTVVVAAAATLVGVIREVHIGVQVRVQYGGVVAKDEDGVDHIFNFDPVCGKSVAFNPVNVDRGLYRA